MNWGVVAAGCLLVAGCTTVEPKPVTAEKTADKTAEKTAEPGHPVEVLTHCGLEFLKFDGRTWRADTPQPEPKPRPSGQGVTRYTGYTSGTVTVDGDTLRFTVDDSKFHAPGGAVVFRPTAAEPPLCQ